MGGDPNYPSNAERKFADLIKADLDITVEPKLLRLFVLHNWEKLSLYAHAVHGTPAKKESLPPEVTRVLDLLADMEWDKAIQALREYRKKAAA